MCPIDGICVKLYQTPWHYAYEADIRDKGAHHFFDKHSTVNDGKSVDGSLWREEEEEEALRSTLTLMSLSVA